MWLTKRANRFLEFDRWLEARGIAWPGNLWAGVSVTSQSKLPRLGCLGDMRARVKFASFEPIAEPFTAEQIRAVVRGGVLPDMFILGGESGLGCPETPIEALTETADAVNELGAKLFVKQIGALPTRGGEVIDISSAKGGELAEFPEELRVREFPRWTGHDGQAKLGL